MDERPGPRLRHPLIATGVGACVPSRGAALDGDVLPWLKSRKMHKYMGKQDELAVVAAGRALANAAVNTNDGARIGIYLCVGYIPFERADIDAITAGSLRDGQFSMEQFSTVGIEQVNPLLTFRCLPNMPAFHVSLNFGLRGPYFVTYPGIGQFYLALEAAATALSAGEVDYALVGGVADQRNFLVEYHFSRLPRSGVERPDAAAVLCLETRAHASDRRAPRRAELLELDIDYQPHDPLAAPSADFDDDALGPASLACALHDAAGGELVHAARTRDGIRASSRWSLA
jgi:3-oxoacyl-(acyl-carrier-protein) synthase